VGILLLLLGILAAGSGALKLRARSRAMLGASGLAVVEATAGGLTILGSGLGVARLRPLAWTVVAAVAALVIISTVVQARRLIARQRARLASEERRLAARLGGRGRFRAA
jgi:hypothetical protein